MNAIKQGQLPDLPDTFQCPICGAPVVVDDIDEWEENDDGTWQVSENGIQINCSTEPDIDSDDWDDWERKHWSMPYVEWLPLSMKVAKYVQENYRFEMRDDWG